MPRLATPALLAAGALLLIPTGARAHSIETDLHLSGGASHSHPHGEAAAPGASARILLHSAFSSGEPARDATVRLISAGSEPRLLGRTDASGRLAFALPSATAADAEIQIDAGAGHRDWISLSELRDGRLQAGSPGSTLRGTLLCAAPFAALGLLGGLVAAGLRRRRG